MAKPTKPMVRWFLGLNGWFTAWKFVVEALSAGDVIMLGLFAPIQLVAVYTLTKYVADALGALLTNPLQGVQPGFGGLIGGGELQRAVRARNEFMLFNWLVLTVVGVTILVWNRSFVGLWVGDRFYASELATLLIVLTTIQWVLIRSESYVIDVTLKVRTKVLMGLVASAASLGLAIPLTRRYGIIGVAAAFLAGRALLSLTYPLLVGRCLGQTFGAQVRGALRPAALMTALFTTAFVVGRRIHAGSWFHLVVDVTATMAASLAVALYVGCARTQRRRLFKRVRRAGRLVRAREAT